MIGMGTRLLLDWNFQVQGLDLGHEVFAVVDHVSGAHAFARLDGLFAGCGGYHRWKIQHTACELDGCAADAAAAVDLVRGEGLVVV